MTSKSKDMPVLIVHGAEAKDAIERFAAEHLEDDAEFIDPAPIAALLRASAAVADSGSSREALDKCTYLAEAMDRIPADCLRAFGVLP